MRIKHKFHVATEKIGGTMIVKVRINEGISVWLTREEALKGAELLLDAATKVRLYDEQMQ